MTPIPAKPINELEKKTWVSDQDLILIVDSVTGEARVADKEELRGVGISNITKSKNWKTTTITIHTTDGESYQVQLEDGDSGNDGLTPEFILEGAVFKRKMPNESDWKTLFDTTSFRGEKGDKGNDGKNPEFQLWSTHLQWRLEGESEWKNLIPKEQIRGATITNIAKTAGNGAPWTTDTYTITLSDSQTFNFFVYHGRDGVGSGDMLKANNLSDLTNKAQARENLWAEAKENKKTDIEANKNSHSFFPTIKAVYDWVINKLNGKANSNHNHDTVYAKKSELTQWLNTKANVSHSHSKADVGLGNVDNTSDAQKNEATATLKNKTINGDQNTISKVDSLKNQNGNTEIKTRAGTKAQHTAVGTKDANTLYFVTES